MNDHTDRMRGTAASLAAEAYSIVRYRILRGELSLGQAVSRRQLASELGMSFLPITEALLKLECEGLLESRPRAGTRVRIPSPADVEGQYVVREALEAHAARLFTETATEKDRVFLMKLAGRVDLLSGQADRTLYVELHQKLHRGIAEATRCNALCEAIDKTHALAATWFCVKDPQDQPQAATSRHQELLRVLCSGDAAKAEGAMRAHIMSGLQHVLQVLDPYFQMKNDQGTRFSRRARTTKTSTTH